MSKPFWLDEWIHELNQNIKHVLCKSNNDKSLSRYKRIVDVLYKLINSCIFHSKHTYQLKRPQKKKKKIANEKEELYAYIYTYKYSHI